MTCNLDDDEADIEAEIQRELDALEDDSLQIEDVEEDNSTLKASETKEDGLPDSLQEYLRLLHSRTDGAEEEVKECEIILEKLPPDSLVKEDEALLARRIKEELGDDYKENPLALRDQVLTELEEAELREEREKLAAENINAEENPFALDIIRPGVVEEIQALEEKAQQELKELEAKQAGKDQEREKWYQERRQEEEQRWEREKEARLRRQAEFETAHKNLLKEQEALKTKLEVEAREEERKLKEMEEIFQVEIRVIDEERRKQKKEFVETQRKEAEYQGKKQEAAATKIQKFYRGFRVRKQYKPLIDAKRVERMQKGKEELDRIERVEKKLREGAERKKLEEEQRRKEEIEKRKREEERRKQEETEKERKLKEEERIREGERRKKEEQERKRVLEEEKGKKEEEARKKREEEERIREEERRKKEEQERKRVLEEEKRKKDEEARKKREEEEKLREAELKRKMEEDQRKAEEEARKKREEEEKLREAELKRKMEEEKGKAEEENKRRQEEKRRMELEEKKKQNLKEEEIKLSELKKSDLKGPGLTLSKELEARRLQWVKEHTPWSTMSTAEERSHPVAIKSKPRRVFSASKHLPLLTEEQLLQSSPPQTTLFRVKCIALKDIPSCTMQGLSKCPEIRSVTLQNCGLLAVEGLEKCKELQELHVENNNVEAINCRELSKLEEASLANNNLASVHGLEGCNGVMSLNLSNNKITRIGDLSSCSKLQQLIMDNNQLINTKGLSCLTNLQHLSLANNHLARVNEIEKCMLLQTLNLQENNLQEPPHLVNCVLLRELRLDDNSISSLDSLSSAWLPLLQFLSVGQNSISQLAPLRNLIMLESLDISNNLISDTDSLIPGLQGCCRLKTLKIEGNPVHEDPDCRTLILETLTDLRSLDGENIPGKNKVSPTNQVAFVDMCQNQLRSQDDLQSRHKREVSEDVPTRDPELVCRRLDLMSQHHRERFELAVRHLLEHENFSADNFQSVVKEARREERNRIVEKTTELRDNLDEEQRRSDTHSLDPLKQRHASATKIQALWRGWYIRRLIDINTTKWLAAVSIQSAWRGYVVRSSLKKEAREQWDPQRSSAATVIQAHFRGQRVRRRLAEALRAAQFYDEDEEEEFDYDEEVDLTAFDFDETSLEQGWTPSDTPQLPARGPVLRLPGQSSKNLKPGSHVLNEPTAPKPRHAWRSADSPITDVNQAPVAKVTLDHDQMSVASGAQSHLSHRAEELSSEWGFRSSETAELMMRRAKKMKYNPARRKKLLDPNKRLALFKKLEETNKLRDVRPPPTRRQPPNRVDYFAARQAIANHMASTSPASEQHNREQMTYSWVYRQAVVHEDEEKNIMADRKEYAHAPENRTKKTSPQKSNRSPVNLPHMDPVVLSGRTLPLISSPLFPQSVEQTPSEGTSPRRNSLSSEGRVRFPAIKTHSVPNLLARSTASGDQPMKAEKSNSAGARINRESRNKR